MAFELAEIYVDIGADDKEALAAIDRAGKACEHLKGIMGGVQVAAGLMFGALKFVQGFLVKEAANDETGLIRLKAALSATGQESNGTAERIVKFADKLQDATTLSKAFIIQLAAMAAQKGVSGDQIENIVKMGVGLGERFFGGDAQAGVDAAVEAYEGKIPKALSRLIPELRRATSAQDAFNILQKAAVPGLEMARAETQTFSGAVKQFVNDIDRLAGEFGMLQPALKHTVDFVRGLVIWVRNLSDVQKEHVMHWLKVASAVTAVVALGPSVLKFGSSVVSTFYDIAKGAIALSISLATSLVSPWGLVILGIAGVATAFVYLLGAGDGVVNSLTAGFKRIWDAITFVLKNTSTAGDAWAMAWRELAYLIGEGWIGAKGFLEGIWTDLAATIVKTATSAATSVLTIWTKMVASYKTIVNTVGDWFGIMLAKDQAAAAEWEKALAHGYNASKDPDKAAKLAADTKKAQDVAEATYRDNASRQNQVDDQVLQEKLRKIKLEGVERQKYLEDERKKALDSIHQETAEAKAAKEKDRKAFEANRKQEFDKSGMQSLWDKGKDLFDKIKSGDILGIGELQKWADAIKKSAQDLTNQKIEAPKNGKINPQAEVGQVQMSSLEEFFKKDTGNMVLQGATNAKDAAEDSRKKREEHQKKIEEHTRKTAELTQVLVDNMQTGGAVFG